MNKLGLIMLQHGHMAVGTDILPSLQTFGRNFDQNFVYNTEMKKPMYNGHPWDP